MILIEIKENVDKYGENSLELTYGITCYFRIYCFPLFCRFQCFAKIICIFKNLFLGHLILEIKIYAKIIWYTVILDLDKPKNLILDL